MAEKQTITLDEALKFGKVFVRNCTKPKGPIHLTLMHASGKTESISVPKTYIPIELTAQVPLSLLESSVDFRAYINSQVLELVHPDEAKKILGTKQAKAEIQKLFASKYSETRSGAPVIAPNINQENIPGATAASTITPPMEEEESINARVMDIILREMKSVDTINELKTIEEELNKTDLRYIANNSKGRVRRWAIKRSKEIK